MTRIEFCKVLVDEDRAPLDPRRRPKVNHQSVRRRRRSRRSEQWRHWHCEHRLYLYERDRDVSVQRLLDIYAIMGRLQREGTVGFALCAVAAEFTSLDGAGIAMISDRDQLMSLCT